MRAIAFALDMSDADAVARGADAVILTHQQARGRVEERHARMMAGFGAAPRYVGAR